MTFTPQERLLIIIQRVSRLSHNSLDPISEIKYQQKESPFTRRSVLVPLPFMNTIGTSLFQYLFALYMTIKMMPKDQSSLHSFIGNLTTNYFTSPSVDSQFSSSACIPPWKSCFPPSLDSPVSDRSYSFDHIKLEKTSFPANASSCSPVWYRSSSFDFVKLEESPLSANTPSCLPGMHGGAVELHPLSSMSEIIIPDTENMSTTFTRNDEPLEDRNMGYDMVPTYVGSIGEAFGSSQTILFEDQSVHNEELYTPQLRVAPYIPYGLVAPSQTIFMDPLDVSPHSPPVSSMQSDLRYGNYQSDLDANHSTRSSTPNGATCLMPKSAPLSFTGSTESTLKASTFEPVLPSAVQQTQSVITLDRKANIGRHPRKRTNRDGSKCTLPNNIQVQKLGTKECMFPGCNKRFQRQEHLKRHQRIHTKPESYSCGFCEKTFGRQDNLKPHILRHATRKPGHVRTKYNHEAKEVYAQLCRRSGRSRNSHSRAKTGRLS